MARDSHRASTARRVWRGRVRRWYREKGMRAVRAPLRTRVDPVLDSLRPARKGVRMEEMRAGRGGAAGEAEEAVDVEAVEAEAEEEEEEEEEEKAVRMESMISAGGGAAAAVAAEPPPPPFPPPFKAPSRAAFTAAQWEEMSSLPPPTTPTSRPSPLVGLSPTRKWWESVVSSVEARRASSLSACPRDTRTMGRKGRARGVDREPSLELSLCRRWREASRVDLAHRASGLLFSPSTPTSTATTHWHSTAARVGHTQSRHSPYARAAAVAAAPDPPVEVGFQASEIISPRVRESSERQAL
jgi:hypothetical protein